MGSIAAALRAGYVPASSPITPPSNADPIAIRMSRMGVHSWTTDTITTVNTPSDAPTSPPSSPITTDSTTN